MVQKDFDSILTQEFLDELLPPERTDQFFDALYGDASEGAYDIRLEPISISGSRIVLAFNLLRRPDKCLVCSLTYGLPNVFTRHPLINIKGMVEKLKEAGIPAKKWRLGDTEENSPSLHVIPLYIDLD